MPAGPSHHYLHRNFLLSRKMRRLTLTLALLKSFMMATPSYWSWSRSWGRGQV